MKVWWCNQTHSWEAERAAGVVRSSGDTPNDRFRRTVAAAEKGDIVVHYRSPTVVAFSRALMDGERKDVLPAPYNFGWEFRTEYSVLRKPIHRDRFVKRIDVTPVKGFALARSGRVNQGYFFHFSTAGLGVLAVIASADGEVLPDWLREFATPLPLDLEEVESLYVEGSRYRQHLVRERNRELAEEAKRIHGYNCQACGFDFQARYGRRGHEFIEAHHRTPMSELPDDEDVMLSPLNDFAVVCANCHRMLHRRPSITVEDLKKSLGT